MIILSYSTYPNVHALLIKVEIGHFFQAKSVDIFLHVFLHENTCCGTHKKRLGEALLMSTHNICFRVEIRKYLSDGLSILELYYKLFRNIRPLISSTTTPCCGWDPWKRCSSRHHHIELRRSPRKLVNEKYSRIFFPVLHKTIFCG